MRPIAHIARRARSGFTLVEVAITGTLLVLVLGGIALAVNRGLGLFQQSSANQYADATLDRALNRIKSELMNASAASLAPNLAVLGWADNVEYRTVSGWAAGATTLENVKRIELRLADGELDNGIDDDGDGLVDERTVVLLRDFGLATEQEVVIAHDVLEYLEGETDAVGDENGNGLNDESGLSFDINGGTLNVRLSIGREGPNGVIARTRVASIALRN